MHKNGMKAFAMLTLTANPRVGRAAVYMEVYAGAEC